MKIKIQKTSEINVRGIRSNGNCKPVFCITTGEVYASSIDAAEANGMHQSNISALILSGGTSRSGKKFCYIANITEHLEEIAENNRVRTAKVTAYDEAFAKKEAERKAKEDLERHKANCEKLRKKLDEEIRLMKVAEVEVNSYNNQQSWLN